MEELVKKYNVPVPRYTSYPAVPFWQEEPLSRSAWMQHVCSTFNRTNDSKGISLYLHLPYCESLCTYCGCTKRITRNHQVETPYVNSLLSEWRTYLRHFDKPPVIRELHLGGGTPTFFSPDNLRRLVNYILGGAVIHPEHNFGFEGSPNNTSTAQLKALYEIGFRRLSLGVQDFSTKVQQAVNRINSFEEVNRVVAAAREIGYKSVNIDLIYGLPFQNRASITQTMVLVGDIRPDRIAFYSYAHVPWKSPSQRGYSESDLPIESEKRTLYETGKFMLTEMGYNEIGMDHFALETDSLYQAFSNHTLHRNFMGYTESQTDLLIGLGASAISDANTAYAQNDKKVESYQATIEAQGLAVFRGHFLSNQEQLTRDTIIRLICDNQVTLPLTLLEWLNESVSSKVEEMKLEGLIELEGVMLRVTPKGRPFIRNICSLFDRSIHRRKITGEQLFSKAI